jgi:hypothetical protein
MGMEGVYQKLLGLLGAAIATFPDLRQGKNRRYTMADITRGAFGVFFCQSPSFLAHQQLMEQAQGRNNAQTLFGVQHLPSDNHIRSHLDAVDPRLLRAVFQQTSEYLVKEKALERFRSVGNTLLVALDGTGYFSSEKLHCDQCQVAHHHDGRTVYSHSVLLAAVVAPKQAQVIPLQPEFIRPQDGKDRQDCEQRAAQRWLTEVAPLYSDLDLTVLGDALYATQTIIQKTLDAEMGYLFTSKQEAHRYLYEEIASLEKLGEVHSLQRKHWTGHQHQIWRYRWANGVRLRNSDDSLNVNWAELSISGEDGRTTFHTACIGSHEISEQNVQELIQATRTRWKIENEDINTLKTKGYHFEHNFGHGKQFLAATLLSLNLIAFLFHTVLELLDPRCALIRKTLPRRDTFFQHVAVLTQYMCFDGWQQMMLFMLEGLKLADPDG